MTRAQALPGASTLAHRPVAASIALSLFLAGANAVAQASPPASSSGERRGAPHFDHVVFPTGDFPIDVQNVQARVDLGGTVLLKATDTAGRPTAFNFGTPGDTVSGYQVAIQGDVQLFGETAGPDRTTILGGYRPLLIGVTGWQGDYSPLAGRVRIKGIHFEQSDQSAIDVYKAADVVIEDNGISNVVASNGLATGINVFGGGDERRITGTVVVRDNVIRYRAPDAGWSHAIVLDDVAADVHVLRNVIETTQSFSGILVVRQVEGTVRIAGNFVAQDAEVPGSGDAGIYIYANDLWDDIRTSAPRYEVTRNHVVTEGGGIGLVGQRGSIDAPLIARNHITAHMTPRRVFDPEGIYFGGNVSSARVSHNRIEGSGAYGIDLFAFEPGQAAQSSTFVGNDLTHFDATVADVFFDAHTAGNTAVVDPSDVVVDVGTGNRIVRRGRHR